MDLYLVSIFMFVSGFFVYSSLYKHLLLMLMGLEYMILSIFLVLFLFLNMYSYSMYILMFYLVFCVCESVLGLCILVLLVRTHGNDFYYSMNFLW